MPDFRTMFDKEFLYAFNLQGREVTVEIERVKAGSVTGEGGKKSKKPVCYFKGKDKPLALNVTNCKVIAGMYGTNTDGWIGKRITIYPTTTDFGGKTCDCIRVRPGVPRGKDNSHELDENAPPPTESREPGVEG
jgi:hypothetical protein